MNGFSILFFIFATCVLLVGIYMYTGHEFKAISWKIKDKYDIKWTDFEVLNDEQGKPIIKIYCIDYSGIENIDLSLSHCKKYAIANVTVLAK